MYGVKPVIRRALEDEVRRHMLSEIEEKGSGFIVTSN